MKEIKLTQGKVTLVDDEDYEYLNQWKWFAYNGKRTSYAGRHSKIINKKRRIIHLHREIMHPSNILYIDHIDRNGLNNQKTNLRICTRKQNTRNQKRSSSSGYNGVYNLHGRIVAQIRVDGKGIHLGTFKTMIDAAKSRDIAAKKYFGEFANLNFPIQ
jgi:hypothetical protein